MGNGECLLREDPAAAAAAAAAAVVGAAVVGGAAAAADVAVAVAVAAAAAAAAVVAVAVAVAVVEVATAAVEAGTGGNVAGHGFHAVAEELEEQLAALELATDLVWFEDSAGRALVRFAHCCSRCEPSEGHPDSLAARDTEHCERPRSS